MAGKAVGLAEAIGAGAATLRGNLDAPPGFEPGSPELQSVACPLCHGAFCRPSRLSRAGRELVWVAGFEPAASRFQGEHSNQTELHPDCW